MSFKCFDPTIPEHLTLVKYILYNKYIKIKIKYRIKVDKVMFAICFYFEQYQKYLEQKKNVLF